MIPKRKFMVFRESYIEKAESWKIIAFKSRSWTVINNKFKESRRKERTNVLYVLDYEIHIRIQKFKLVFRNS